MSMKVIKKKIQKWDEVTGMPIEGNEVMDTPESQAEGQELVNPMDDNPLKNAEMAMEDDYDSIDGIINNGSKGDIEDALKEEQISVLEKIHEHEEKIKQQSRIPEDDKKVRVPLCSDRELC